MTAEYIRGLFQSSFVHIDHQPMGFYVSYYRQTVEYTVEMKERKDMIIQFWIKGERMR